MNISRKAKNELFWILIFCLAFPLCYLLIFSQGGYLQLRNYRADVHQLHMDNMKLRVRQQDLLQRIHRLKTDPYEIERIAREQYNYARPGDVIVNIPEN